jgi:hypothetical protein
MTCGDEWGFHAFHNPRPLVVGSSRTCCHRWRCLKSGPRVLEQLALSPMTRPGGSGTIGDSRWSLSTRKTRLIRGKRQLPNSSSGPGHHNKTATSGRGLQSLIPSGSLSQNPSQTSLRRTMVAAPGKSYRPRPLVAAGGCGRRSRPRLSAIRTVGSGCYVSPSEPRPKRQTIMT